MPRAPQISEDVRRKIVEAHQAGNGYKLISKSLGLPKATICSILCKWKKFGTIMNLPRSGRPSKISPKMTREIVREVKKNPRLTSKDVQTALAAANITVHRSTLRRIIRVHIRPTLTEPHDIMSLGNSSDEEEGAREARRKLSDTSDGPRKDVKGEKDKDKRDSTKDVSSGDVEKGNGEETLEQHNEDRRDTGYDGADADREKKNIDGADDDSEKKAIGGAGEANEKKTIDVADAECETKTIDGAGYATEKMLIDGANVYREKNIIDGANAYREKSIIDGDDDSDSDSSDDDMMYDDDDNY